LKKRFLCFILLGVIAITSVFGQTSFMDLYLGKWVYWGQPTNNSPDSFVIAKNDKHGINIFGEIIFVLNVNHIEKEASFVISGVGPGESYCRLRFLKDVIEYYSFFDNKWILRGIYKKVSLN